MGKAVSLDVTIRATIPELICMLIYRYHYDRAQEMIRHDSLEVRRGFYKTLIADKLGSTLARSNWDWVHDHNPADLTSDREEYAEAALHNIAPTPGNCRFDARHWTRATKFSSPIPDRACLRPAAGIGPCEMGARPGPSTCGCGCGSAAPGANKSWNRANF